MKYNLKEAIKKIWNFLWKSNSVWSWLVDLILVFIIVKFIFFPFFSLILVTPLPFVIIESDSMHHTSDFDSWYTEFGSWYENNGITKQEMLGWPYQNGLDKGDIIVVQGKNPQEYNPGDVIIFNTKVQKTPIIHRVVEITEEQEQFMFSTKGDNNQGQLIFLGLNIEKEINKENVLGRAAFRIPYLGWIKLAFVELFSAIF